MFYPIEDIFSKQKIDIFVLYLRTKTQEMELENELEGQIESNI